eukprot:2518055-Rhodomonas_salina.1
MKKAREELRDRSKSPGPRISGGRTSDPNPGNGANGFENGGEKGGRQSRGPLTSEELEKTFADLEKRRSTPMFPSKRFSGVVFDDEKNPGHWTSAIK